MWNDLKNLAIAFGVLVKHFWESLGNLLVWAIRFFGPAAGSLKGVISPEEFYRVIMIAISGSGSFYGAVEYTRDHINEFVSDPILISSVNGFVKHVHSHNLYLAIFIVIFTFDYIRRKYLHGEQH